MLESTPMPCTEHSNDALLCQQASALPVWTRTGMVETQPIIAAVARAYSALYHLAADVTPAAILGPGRGAAVAPARPLCADLLAEDYHLTNMATARALGRADHTTALNSRARIAAALPCDALLVSVLDRARADLAGHRCDEDVHTRCEERRRRRLAAASPHEWDEYRYWRMQARRSLQVGTWGGA